MIERPSTPPPGAGLTGSPVFRRGLILLALIALVGCSSPPGPRIPAPPPADPSRPAEEVLAELKDWIDPPDLPTSTLYAGDAISVEIKGHPEYSIPSRVIPHDGMIPLSGLRGKTVQTIRKTTQQLEKEIAEAYSALLVDPYVTVNVRNYATRVVYVLGEVRQSGKFNIPQDTRLSLVQAIAEAGGPAETADRTKVRIRRDDPKTRRKITSPPIDLDVILQAGVDIPLTPNDTIQVPKLRALFVSIWGRGIQRPGTYPWTEDLTVSRLIPLAGGLEKFADMSNVLILRREAEGQQTFRVDLNRIYGNRDPDFLLRPGDVVRIDDTFF
jgi:polysaccharide export outer membrane protein